MIVGGNVGLFDGSGVGRPSRNVGATVGGSNGAFEGEVDGSGVGLPFL